MGDFLDFWVRDNHYDSSGYVSGEIELSGDINTFELKSSLEAFDGHIQGLSFNTIDLHATGVYPKIQVEQTLISKSDGFTFMVAGPVDLSDKENFKKQIKALG